LQKQHTVRPRSVAQIIVGWLTDIDRVDRAAAGASCYKRFLIRPT
jgi:hypothetical protein